MRKFGLSYSGMAILSIIAIITVFSFLSGCNIIPGQFDNDDDSYSAVAVNSSISGKITQSGVTPSNRQNQNQTIHPADISGLTGIANAEVWIEELAADPKYHTTTDASGAYTIKDVPVGSHRIITRFSNNGNLTVMKNRSGIISVANTNTPVTAPDLPLIEAKNIVTGQLRDSQGQLLPYGTVLTLWGETFRVGENGTFSSPPLPEGFSTAEIYVQLNNGSTGNSFSAPFVSDVVPAFLDFSIGTDQETGNNAPTVVLTAKNSQGICFKTSTGSRLNINAIANDRDTNDQNQLKALWSCTAGTLSSGTTELEALWTAPDYAGMATISVMVTDPQGATGTGYLPMLVGIDNPSQVDSTQPSVKLETDITETEDNKPFTVKISFSEPVTGFELTDLAVENGSAKDLSELELKTVFSCIITPSAEGEVKISVPEKVAKDSAGNSNTKSSELVISNKITKPVLSSEKSLLAFSFIAPEVTASIDEENKAISVTVPFGTDLLALVAKFSLSTNASLKIGDTAQSSRITANNFTSDVTYTVIAQDGSTANYKVSVKIAAATGKDITSFSLVNPSVNGVIDETGKTITLTVPFGTDISALIAKFTLSPEASAKIGETLQTSQTTANNFASSKIYKITAQDGSTANYTVTVKIAPATGNAILAFSFVNPAVTATINEANKTISATLPFGTDLSALVARFTLSANAVAKIGDVTQTSETTANDFSSALTYKVIAENGTISNWTINVSIAQPDQISGATVTMVAPVLGATPQDAAAVQAATDNDDYTVTGLTWNQAMTADGKFKAGQVYTATVTLTSKNNKKFQAEAFTPVVSGSASVGATTTTGTSVGNTVTFTVNFASTGNSVVTSIAVTTQPTKLSYAEATDGTLALNGMIVTETNNDGSTNTVTFTDGTASGYTTNPANGATLTNAANNGNAVVVTHTASSKTANTSNLTVSPIVEITAAAVTINAPVLGVAPQNAAAVEAATANADYTVTGLTWNQAMTADGKFKAGQTYTATVTLTSKNSKKFQTAAFTPTVSGSASVGTTTTTGTAIGNTVSFTVTYNSTGALAVSSIAVTTQPTKMSYAEATDGTLALNGMVVTETNNDGSTNTVTFTDGTASGYTANPANGAALTNATNNGNAVVVTHTASSKTANTSNLAVSAIVEITAATVPITAPVLGVTPQNAAAVEAATANSDYTVTALTWNEALTAGGKFKAAQVYTATVTLTSKNNKKFQTDAFTPIVSGSASVGTTTTTGTAIGNTVSFTVTYNSTGALAVSSIAVTTQPTKMSYAETTDGTLALNAMVVTETNNDGSTNTVTFTDGTASGYTANPANGAALTNATNNAQPVVVTHTASSRTANTSNLTVSPIVEITAAAVSITAPVLGETPQNAAAVEAATANSDYTVTGLTWNEALTAGGKFKAGQVYTATVTLTSKNNKKFQTAPFTPTVAGSASVGTTSTTGTAIGNTVSFTVTYASTGALAVSSIAVTTQPNKMSYAEATDGTLALNGMVVTETNNDGSTNTVTFTAGTATGYTANPANGTVLTRPANNGNAVVVTHTASAQTANTSSLTVIREDYTSANIGTLKFVPAGSFQRDATPTNISTVSAFRMSQYEITRTQFSAIMGTDPSDIAYSNFVTDPVQKVNWYHAIAFCNKLSIAEGLTPAYTVSGVDFSTLAYASVPIGDNATWNAATCNWSANGYRLPTEMEWMWAAMGADQDSQSDSMSSGVNVTGYAKTFAGYNGSNLVDDYAWYSSNSANITHPAGTKTANEIGLYDMSGNVLEWCWDWYGGYSAGSSSNYTGANSGSGRVLRGGSWYNSTTDLRLSFRDYAAPSGPSVTFGFRVLRAH